MAKATFKMPDDFLLKISKLESKTDDILPRVLESGAEVVESRVKANLSAVIGSGTKFSSQSTGELESALGVTKPNQNRNGEWDIKVGFDEPRSDGKSNALIANVLEYGKHNQAPKPFLKPAKRQSRKSCIETMKSKLESEVERI
ncbi:MAG: HK97 gp10 family phage protein [Streptococcaceae bacterium]|jgi:HK97 gp10 family phage protein|nr:HK97 gp10 family phage protein [Streptococcaceae bacterium]